MVSFFLLKFSTNSPIVLFNYNLKVFVFLVASKEALKSGLSDMDYLRSKMAQTLEASDEENEVDEEQEEEGPVQHGDSAYESGERENISKPKPFPGNKKQSAQQEVG